VNTGQAIALTEAGTRPRRERLGVFAVPVALFIVLAVSVSEMPGWNYAVKAMGVLLAAGYVIFTLRTRHRIAPEIYLFIAWITWGLMGVFVARSQTVFWRTVGTVFQIWVMLVILSGFTASRRALSLNLLAFLVAVLIVGGYSYVTGEYRRAEVAGERVAGLALNANEFGWVMLLAAVGLAYFWMLPTRLRLLKFGLLIAGMLGVTAAVVLTGSRKGLLGLLLFFAAWLWFCYRKDLPRRPAVLLVIVLGLAAGAAFLVSIAGGTVMAERLGRTWTALRGGSTHGSGVERLGLYQTAWHVFAEHPLLGVGLNQYRFYSYGMLSAHSEYADVLCSTGIPGFLLYFALFVVFWRRTGKLTKRAPDPVTAKIVGLIRALLLVILITNFARWNYSSKYTWVILASFIGYTASLESRLRAQAGEVWKVSGEPSLLVKPRTPFQSA